MTPHATEPNEPPGISLLCRVGPRLLALPIGLVIETMRPLPIQPLPAAPPPVLGISVVRGVPTPIVDVAALLGWPGVAPTRFVTLASGDRPVALTATAIVGVRDLADAPRLALPTLRGEGEAGTVEALAALGDELVVLLDAARLVPDAVWQQIAERVP